MSNEIMKQRVQQALNEELAHIHTTSRERDQLYENAIGGKVMKHKLKTGLVLALVLVLGTNMISRRLSGKSVW